MLSEIVDWSTRPLGKTILLTPHTEANGPTGTTTGSISLWFKGRVGSAHPTLQEPCLEGKVRKTLSASRNLLSISRFNRFRRRPGRPKSTRQCPPAQTFEHSVYSYDDQRNYTFIYSLIWRGRSGKTLVVFCFLKLLTIFRLGL